MEHRTLGKTGLTVSEVGLGAAQIGWGVSDADAERLLKTALDEGISFIDTAAMYGQSEALIGRFLSDRRDEFVLATKCGDFVGEVDGKTQICNDYTREGILRVVDESRRKLKMDVIDVVQFHGLPREGDDPKEAFEALLEAKEKGWATFVGVSADGPAAAAAAREWPLDTQEFTYNILHQESADDLMPTLREQGMGTIIKRPMANAIFLKNDRPDGDTNGTPWDRARRFPLADLAGGAGPMEFALRFALSHPDVHVAITGTTNPKHLAANARVSDGTPLDEDTVAAARRAFEEMKQAIEADAA